MRCKQVSAMLLATAAVLGAFSGMVCPNAAQATPMTINNNSFESPDASANDGTNFYEPGATIPSWSYTGGAVNGGVAAGQGIYHETTALMPLTPHGTQWLGLVVDAADGGAAGDETNLYIWQKVGTVAQATYTLNYLVGARGINHNYVPPDGSFKISLWAGGTAPFAANSATLLGEDSSIDIPETPDASPEANATSAQSSVFAVNTNIGQDLWLRLHLVDDGTSAAEQSNQILFDNITGEFEVVPEPASLALLAAGGLMMIRRRRA